MTATRPGHGSKESLSIHISKDEDKREREKEKSLFGHKSHERGCDGEASLSAVKVSQSISPSNRSPPRNTAFVMSDDLQRQSHLKSFLSTGGEEEGGGGEEVAVDEEEAIDVSPVLDVQRERHLQQDFARGPENLELVGFF